ncbi:hypothetical protein FRB99_004786, partial [Tulasnella sp. 403]
MSEGAMGPKLVEIDLTNVSPDWGTCQLTGLQTLRLYNICPGPTLEQLIDIIQNSPNLHDLAIQICTIKRTSPQMIKIEPLSSPTSRVLDVLELFDLSPETMCAILSCVTIHEWSRFTLQNALALNSNEAAAIMAFSFKHVSSLAPSHLEVNITDYDYTLWYSAYNCHIALYHDEADSIQDLVQVVNEQLVEAFPGLYDVGATLRIRLDEVADPLPIMCILDRHLNVTKLDLDPLIQPSVLRAFTHPLPSGRWLFPNLNGLEMFLPLGTVMGDRLPKVVRARWEASTKAKCGDTKP